MAQSNASNDAMNDSLNFVKKLWGQMGVPGMSMSGTSAPGMPGLPGLPTMPLPTMSLEDLDKRIQELKTVETWLNVNMTMLRNTIQAMEVQRATIATLHSLSSTMANTMQGMSGGKNSFFGKSADSEPQSSDDSNEGGDDGQENAEEVSPLIAQSAAWWQGVQDQFRQALGTALEKSTANYEAAKSASDKLVKATTAAAAKTAKATRGAKAKPATAPTKSKSRTSTARKSPARGSRSTAK